MVPAGRQEVSMTVSSLLLVVLAALVHATWNLLSKQAADAGPTFVFAYCLFAVVAYAPWVLWLVAQGNMPWSWPAAGVIMVSGLIHLVYSLVLQAGYGAADFSVVYPVARGSGPLLSTLGALLVLGEALTGLRILGLLGVVAGITLIATQGELAAFRRPRGQTGVAWGGATGGCIAAYTVVDAWAVKALGVPPVILDWFSNLLRLVLLLPLVAANLSRARDLMQGKWLLALGVGLLSPLSYILVLSALRLGAPLSVVAPMREMSMMAGTLLGMLVLGERVGPWRLVGCAVLIGGVVALGSSA
jgi:drug/metabolite transporter (DMT)-like permease